MSFATILLTSNPMSCHTTEQIKNDERMRTDTYAVWWMFIYAANRTAIFHISLANPDSKGYCFFNNLNSLTRSYNKALEWGLTKFWHYFNHANSIKVIKKQVYFLTKYSTGSFTAKDAHLLLNLDHVIFNNHHPCPETCKHLLSTSGIKSLLTYKTINQK